MEPGTNPPKAESSKVNWRFLPSKLECKVCQEICDEIADMKRHILKKHSKQTVMKPKSQKDKTVKAKMMGEVDLSVVLSDFEVSKLSQLVRLCPYCNKYVNGIAKHISVHEPDDERSVCEFCEKVFPKIRQYYDHRSKCKQRPRKSSRTCPHCDKVLSSKDKLRIHVRKMHKGRRQQFMCETCGKVMKTKAALHQHKITHLLVKPHECPECGKGFSQKCNMMYHRRVHTGEKPYQCDLCDEKFTHNVSLKTHKKKTHGIDMWANNDHS